LRAREALKAGGQLDIRTNRPRNVEVVIADNQAQRYGDYQLVTADRRPIDTFERAHESLLVASHFAETAQRLRAFFGRRLPLWEGHTPPALEELVEATITHRGDPAQLAGSLVTFLNNIGKRFSPSAFGDRLVREAREGCALSTSGKPAAIQALARHIVETPDHRGVSGALRALVELQRTNMDFAQVEMDCHAEFWKGCVWVGTQIRMKASRESPITGPIRARNRRPRQSAPSMRPRAWNVRALSSCRATRRPFPTALKHVAFSTLRSVARRAACCWSSHEAHQAH
jgi:hypothetical protein